MKSFAGDAVAADAAGLKLVEMNDFSTCTFPLSHFQVPAISYIIASLLCRFSSNGVSTVIQIIPFLGSSIDFFVSSVLSFRIYCIYYLLENYRCYQYISIILLARVKHLINIRN